MRAFYLIAIVAVGGCGLTQPYPILAGVPGSRLDVEVQRSVPLTAQSRLRLKALVSTAYMGKPKDEAIASLQELGMDCGLSQCLFVIDYPPGERELPLHNDSGRSGANYSLSVWFGGPMLPRLVEGMGPPPGLDE